jgi:NAD(P)H-dependent FMN reductase
MNPLKIGIIIGSVREGRFGEHAAAWIERIAREQEGIEVTMLDLKDHMFPFYTDAISPSMKNGVYENPLIATWAEKIKNLDGYIMVTPEYNHSTSGVLKNALDQNFGEYANKPVAFVAYGNVGGARAVEHLRMIAIEHQMAPIRNAVHIMAPWGLKEADGTLKAGALDSYRGAGDGLVTQLMWWARALKAARENA